LTNQDSAGGKKLYCPDVKLTSQERHALKSGNLSHWRWHSICSTIDIQFQKPFQFPKSEKYEPFCVSKLEF